MKIVHLSGSTKGEYLVDGSQIHIYVGTKNSSPEPNNLTGWVRIEDKDTIAEGIPVSYGTDGLVKTGSAAIPAYSGKPVRWDKWLSVPDEIDRYKILSECAECQEIYKPDSGYRDMVMTGSFENNPI